MDILTNELIESLANYLNAYRKLMFMKLRHFILCLVLKPVGKIHYLSMHKCFMHAKKF